MKKTIFVILLLVCLTLLIFSGCGSKKYQYSVVSSDVYLAGELMRGQSPRSVDIELTLSSSSIKKGTKVGLDYFGTHYDGTVKNNNRVSWDTTPVVVADATFSSTTIENYNSSIKLTFIYYLQGLEVKNVLIFSEK